MNYGTVRVTLPGGEVWEHPLETPAARIGRSPENQIVVEHPTVSPRHARVSIDSGQCFIEDVGSESGTFVGVVRLVPGERQLFGMAPVRMGDVAVEFLAAEPETVGGGAGRTFAVPPPAARQPLVASMEGPAEPIAPGGTDTATVEIQNRGSTVDEIAISVENLAAGWASVSREVVTLLPGARDEVIVTFSPPRGLAATAGDHPFMVTARSSVHHTEARVAGTLSVSAVPGFSLVLQPVRAARDFKLALENTGNAAAALSLAARDDEGRLRFDFETMNVDLQPGERRTLSLRVRMPGAPKLGPEVIRAFRVEAAGPGLSQAASGQLRIKPKLEPWRLPAIAVVVVGALAGGGVAYASRCEDWGLPGCGTDAGAPAASDSDAQARTATAQAAGTAGGGDDGTATAGTSTVETPTAPPATATTPAAPPTKHVTGTLRFPKAEIVLDPSKDYLAIVTTSAGEFVIDLDVAGAYETSNSFAFLGQMGFYDGMPFEPMGSSVEHGDPEGDGTGTAGYVQKVEPTGVDNDKGTVGMLRPLSDPGVVGSQWYLNLEDNPQFDTARIRGNPRPVFGTVIKGLEVAAKLTEKDTVERITIEEK